jgi:hypothetical protein
MVLWRRRIRGGLGKNSMAIDGIVVFGIVNYERSLSPLEKCWM